MPKLIEERKPEIIDEIKKLFIDQDLSMNKTAQKLKIAAVTVSRILRKEKIYKKTKLTPEYYENKKKETLEMIELHRQGKSITAIAAQFSITYSSVRDRFVSQGVTIRTNSQWREEQRQARVEKAKKKEEEETEQKTSRYHVLKRAKYNQTQEMPEAGQCKFILNDTFPYVFCQEKAIEGKSYCKHHYDTCHEKTNLLK